MEIATLKNNYSTSKKTLKQIQGTGKWIEDGQVYKIHSIEGSFPEDMVVNICFNEKSGVIQSRKYETDKFLFFVSDNIKAH